MSAAPDLRLLANLQTAGLVLSPGAAGRLRVTPADKVTPELRARILARKPALLAALDLQRRIRAMAQRWAYDADDLAYALESARENPAGWLACVVDDERRTDGSRDCGLRWPL